LTLNPELLYFSRCSGSRLSTAGLSGAPRKPFILPVHFWQTSLIRSAVRLNLRKPSRPLLADKSHSVCSTA